MYSLRHAPEPFFPGSVRCTCSECKKIDHYTIYEGTLIIRNDADGKSYLYDMVDVAEKEKKKAISSASSTAKRSEVFEPMPSFEDKVAKPNENVNNQFSLSLSSEAATGTDLLDAPVNQAALQSPARKKVLAQDILPTIIEKQQQQQLDNAPPSVSGKKRVLGQDLPAPMVEQQMETERKGSQFSVVESPAESMGIATPVCGLARNDRDLCRGRRHNVPHTGRNLLSTFYRVEDG